jgi:NAD(P)H dehydrogenase (quinone)
MNVLVVYCHPAPESYGAAVRDSAVRGLERGGHTVRLVDLYAIGFDPVMSPQEWRRYHAAEENETPIAEHLALLRWCEGLVFVYPTWWYGPPAMLKGWLERVWVPHATFTLPEGERPIGPVLTNIRFLAAVSTLGSPWWWWTIHMKEPGRRIILRGLKILCAPRCRTLWVALHKLDSASDRQRRNFLARVEKKFAAIRS